MYTTTGRLGNVTLGLNEDAAKAARQVVFDGQAAARRVDISLELVRENLRAAEGVLFARRREPECREALAMLRSAIGHTRLAGKHMASMPSLLEVAEIALDPRSAAPHSDDFEEVDPEASDPSWPAFSEAETVPFATMPAMSGGGPEDHEVDRTDADWDDYYACRYGDISEEDVRVATGTY